MQPLISSVRLAILALLLFTIASCQKQKKDKLAPDHTWTIDDVTYTQQYGKWIIYDNWRTYSDSTDSVYAYITGTDTAYNQGISFSFIHKPTVAGIYRAVYYPEKDDEVLIQTYRSGSRPTSSRDETGGQVTLRINNGHTTLTGNDIQLRNYTFVVDYNSSCSFNITAD